MIVALTMSATIVSCKDKIETASGIDLSKIPSEETTNIKILYTENGDIKYDFVAKKIDHYINDTASYYIIPKGFYGQSYVLIDSVVGLSVANADIRADGGLYRQNPDFFEAYHNVVARNLLIEQSLETDTLYYDPSKEEEAIYSFSPSVIKRPLDTIPAISGFYTDRQFKMYGFTKVRRGAAYYVESATDSTSNDTTNVLAVPVDAAATSSKKGTPIILDVLDEP